MSAVRTSLFAAIVTVAVIAGCSSEQSATEPLGGAAGDTTVTADSSTSSSSDASTTSTPSAASTSTTPTTAPTTATDAASSSGPPLGSSGTVFPAGDIDPALQAYIDLAISDLSGRLHVDPMSVETHSAVLVVWPDSSLGCAEKGQQYAQVLSDGTLIELSVDRKIYRYHAGESTTPFLCEQPMINAPTTVA